jgi:hypothetical protein
MPETGVQMPVMGLQMAVMGLQMAEMGLQMAGIHAQFERKGRIGRDFSRWSHEMQSRHSGGSMSSALVSASFIYSSLLLLGASLKKAMILNSLIAHKTFPTCLNSCNSHLRCCNSLIRFADTKLLHPIFQR